MNTKNPQFQRFTTGRWLLLAITILVIIFLRPLLDPDSDDRPDQSPAAGASVEPERRSDPFSSASGGNANRDPSAQSSDTQVTPSSIELEPKGLESKGTGPHLGELRPIGNDVLPRIMPCL